MIGAIDGHCSVFVGSAFVGVSIRGGIVQATVTMVASSFKIKN